MDVIASSDPLNLAFVELTTGKNGPTVIGLHGLASTGRSLRPALCHLVNHGIRVLLPDLLGHGASPWPSELAYDLDDHLAALEAWANGTLGSEAVWLVGNSMGALLALAWAARNPSRARGVVAISIPLFASTTEARAYLVRGDAMAWLMLRYPDVARALCRRLCGEAGPGPSLLYQPTLSTRPGLGTAASLRSQDDSRGVTARSDNAGDFRTPRRVSRLLAPFVEVAARVTRALHRGTSRLP